MNWGQTRKCGALSSYRRTRIINIWSWLCCWCITASSLNLEKKNEKQKRYLEQHISMSYQITSANETKTCLQWEVLSISVNSLNWTFGDLFDKCCFRIMYKLNMGKQNTQLNRNFNPRKDSMPKMDYRLNIYHALRDKNTKNQEKSLSKEKAYLHYIRIIPWAFIRSKAPSFCGARTRTTQEVWQLTESKRVLSN